MKILHINCDFMGSNEIHRVMIKHLDELNLCNIVFVPTYKSNLVYENKNVKIVKCFNRLDKFFYFFKQRKIYSAIKKEVDISEFDVIHSYTLFTDGNIAYKLNQEYGIPYVIAIRGTDINVFLKYKKYLKPLAKRILKNASKIFYLSNASKESISTILYDNNYPYNNKTQIVPNGLNNFWLDNIYHPKKLNSSKINVVYVGRINKRKNILSTQKALKELNKKGLDISFSFAGPIDDKKIFNSIMSYDNTKYLGMLRKEGLLEVYRKSDIYIMPSHTETFGMTYVEAMTQGLPVIYSKGQGFDNQFKEGQVGYHVRSNNYKDIVEAVMKILKNYDNISSNCIKECTIFNWKLICKKYYSIYGDISKKNSN